MQNVIIRNTDSQSGSAASSTAVWFDVHVERGVTVPARDGTSLVTDVYRPARDGAPIDDRFPVLMERTPYDRGNRRIALAARFYARRGYAVLLQDVRGRGDSGGAFHHLMRRPDEGEDGFDTVHWIVSRSWCNGRIGTFGGSFTAANQQALAVNHPPGLKAQVLRDCGTSYYKRFFRHHGAFGLGRMLPFCLKHGPKGHEARADPAVKAALQKMKREIGDWVERPLVRGASPLAMAPEYEALYFNALTFADDSEYWDTPAARLEGRWDLYPRDVAVLMVSGWYGDHIGANFEKFVELGKRLEKPVHLIVGPWTHGAGMGEETNAGDVEGGPDAARFGPNLDWRLRWFDRWLKDAPNGIDQEPPLRLFVMGTGDGRKTAEGRLFHGGYWRDEWEWPLPGTQLTAFYLHPGGSLRTEPPPAGAEPTRYDFDPENPCPSIGGYAHDRDIPEFMAVGGQDQRCKPKLRACRGADRPLAERSDVLVFQTAPLSEDTEVTGALETRFWVSSSAVDTDFVAKLIDVYPPSEDYSEGYALLLSEGVVRMRYRDDRPTAQLIEPNEVYEIAVYLQPTGNVFKRGHRIRLDITSSNYPEWDANPNTGEPMGRHTHTVVAHQTVFHDAERPSRIVLPIVPSSGGM